MEQWPGTTPSGRSSLESWTAFHAVFPYRNFSLSSDCAPESEMKVKLPCPSPIQNTITGESDSDIQIKSASPSRSISPESRLPRSDIPESNDSVVEDDCCKWMCICL